MSKFGESGPVWEEHVKRKKNIRKVAAVTLIVFLVWVGFNYL